MICLIPSLSIVFLLKVVMSLVVILVIQILKMLDFKVVISAWLILMVRLRLVLKYVIVTLKARVLSVLSLLILLLITPIFVRRSLQLRLVLCNLENQKLENVICLKIVGVALIYQELHLKVLT